MHILYIGQFIPDSFRKKYGGIYDSLYRNSQIIIDGLRTQTNNLDVITLPDIGSYSKTKLLYVPSYDFKEENVHTVSFLNIRFIKTVWGIFSLVNSALNIIRKKPKGEIVYVIIPYMVFKHVFVSRILKTIYPNKVKICLKVPDVFFPKNKINKLFNNWTERMAKKSDCFILYTRAMADYLSVKETKYIVIEGFNNLEPQETKITEGKFIITYTGSLNIRYGLGRLIDAMQFIDSDKCELHIYGDGDAVPYIKEHAKIDSRIKYMGKVTKEIAVNSLYSSNVLVNPRSATDGEYVKYSFPSKDVEYLSSGIPCILCKLPGMPKEYEGHFIDAIDGSAENIAKAIKKVVDMSVEERKTKGLCAQKFILSRMNNKLQAQSIIELMKLN